MRLHPVVRHDPVGIRARHRRENDMVDAGPLGGVEERVQSWTDASDGRRPDKEQRTSSAQRCLERRGHGEVEPRYRHTGEIPLEDFDIRPCWAHGDPGGGKGARDSPADVAGRTGDKDVARHRTGSLTSR